MDLRGAATRPSPRDCGPLPFLIQRDGTWLYQGTPIRRKPMVCLFSSVLRRDGRGRYRLETPAERGEIEVEDVPFVAVELEWRGCGRDQVLAFRTNVDEIVCAGPDNPLQVDWDCVRSGGDCAAIPYLTVRAGDGTHPIQARIARAVYYELAALAVEGRRHGEPCSGVWSQNRFFPIGPLVDAIADTTPNTSPIGSRASSGVLNGALPSLLNDAHAVSPERHAASRGLSPDEDR